MILPSNFHFFKFSIQQKVENASIVELHQHHFGEEMVMDTTCAMHVVFITKWTDKTVLSLNQRDDW